MLGKWFKRESVPNNRGKSDPIHVERLKYSKVFDLELSNMEDSPVYALRHQLSIGSEIGNIIIADPSLSPRHATFILQQEVVSVIDHGSITGTYVNGTKIPTGKYIILEESDVVNVGDLEVKLKVGSLAEASEEIPEIPAEAHDEELLSEVQTAQDMADEESGENGDEADENPQEELSPIKSKSATNALVRVVAVTADILLSYSLLVILLPFDAVKDFLQFIPEVLTSTFDVNWPDMWNALIEDHGFLGEMAQDLFQFFSSTFHFGPLFTMFILTRFISSLILGVSFSEFMLGVKSHGNRVWMRVGGGLRVLLGVLTGPFLIFDIPAIISRRTFKEFLTFTHTYLSSKFVAIIGTFLFLPLMLVLALISPLMQGFAPPEPVLVNDRVDQRIKVKVPQTQEGEERSLSAKSSFLDLELTYNANEVSIFPNFKFQGLKSKLNLKTELLFYEKDLKRTVVLEVYKNFDLKQLLGIGFKGNVFLHSKYPEIYNFVYSAEETNPAFKARNDANSQMAFGNEFIQFTKNAFGLSADNAIEMMENETLLLKSLMDYKASFLSLIEFKNFDQIGFMKIGNVLFMKFSFYQQKPFDLIIPLVKGEGRVFKVTFDERENMGDLASKFYKFNLEKANWLPDQVRLESEVMTNFQVMDFFSQNKKKNVLTADNAQRMYAYYFETSSAVLSHGDIEEIELWQNCVRNARKLLGALSPKAIADEETKMKLEQNFQDLSDALENRNYEYFGIGQATTI